MQHVQVISGKAWSKPYYETSLPIEAPFHPGKALIGRASKELDCIEKKTKPGKLPFENIQFLNLPD